MAAATPLPFYAISDLTNDGRKGLVISYNVLNLPSGVVTTASGSLTYNYLSDGTKVSVIKSDGSGERYIGSFVYSVPASGSEVLESAAWDEGRINFTKSGSSYTKTDLWFVKDHVGNVRTVVNVTLGLSAPQVLERNDFLPFGTRMNAGTAVLTTNRFRLGGKENQTFGSLDLGKVDFGARMYDPFTAGWTTADPLAAKYSSMSPYNYCSGNPLVLFDPPGTSPVYSSNGAFLGTDDEGLKGQYIVMDASLFSQGMTHDDALSHSLVGPIDKQVVASIKRHYRSLKYRPDYDGYVTISEGLNWARTHIGAKDHPTPDNCLYIDVSKVDFGNLSVEKSGLLITNPRIVNLLKHVKWTSPKSINSTYALGNTKIYLVDAEKGTVKLSDDVYDWNYHNPFVNGKPQGHRDKLVFWERRRSAVDDRHGFQLRFYGTGTIMH